MSRTSKHLNDIKACQQVWQHRMISGFSPGVHQNGDASSPSHYCKALRRTGGSTRVETRAKYIRMLR
jgi:hypothetical protein